MVMKLHVILEFGKHFSQTHSVYKKNNENSEIGVYQF